jgi:hypothetical protein
LGEAVCASAAVAATNTLADIIHPTNSLIAIAPVLKRFSVEMKPDPYDQPLGFQVQKRRSLLNSPFVPAAISPQNLATLGPERGAFASNPRQAASSLVRIGHATGDTRALV